MFVNQRLRNSYGQVRSLCWSLHVGIARFFECQQYTGRGSSGVLEPDVSSALEEQRIGLTTAKHVQPPIKTGCPYTLECFCRHCQAFHMGIIFMDASTRVWNLEALQVKHILFPVRRQALVRHPVAQISTFACRLVDGTCS